MVNDENNPWADREDMMNLVRVKDKDGNSAHIWKPFEKNNDIKGMDISKEKEARFITTKISKQFLVEILKNRSDDTFIDCQLFIPMNNDSNSNVKQINNEVIQIEKVEKNKLFNVETKVSLTLNLVILE